MYGRQRLLSLFGTYELQKYEKAWYQVIRAG